MQVTEDDLAKYFGLLGEVNNVIMLRDKFTNRHKVIFVSTQIALASNEFSHKFTVSLE